MGVNSDIVVQLGSDWSGLSADWLSIMQITFSWVINVFVSIYCLLWFVMVIRQCLTKISVRLKCCSIKIAASCVDNVRLFCLTPAEEKKNTCKKTRHCCWLTHCCSWLQCRVLLIINVKLSLTFKYTGNKTSLLEEFLPWCKQGWTVLKLYNCRGPARRLFSKVPH